MADEYICDIPELHTFIGSVKSALSDATTVKERLAVIRPLFDRLLAQPNWLPAEFRRPLEAGGMGKGIANWLLYRETAGSLSLSALVLPPGVTTPIHDHLAWGLVGLYVGEQIEDVYAAGIPVGPDGGHTELKRVASNHLKAGSFYELIPPAGDIHRVTGTGGEVSISLHLLANDIGCVTRHRFDLESGEVVPFRQATQIGVVKQPTPPAARVKREKTDAKARRRKGNAKNGQSENCFRWRIA